MPKKSSRKPELPPDTDQNEKPELGLIRELWALLLVYGTLVVLPLLTGIACES